MAFAKKTWKDRIAEFPTRRRLTKEDNTSELVTVAREEGTLSQEGDAFSADNMNDLENRIDEEFTAVNGKSPKNTDITVKCPASTWCNIPLPDIISSTDKVINVHRPKDADSNVYGVIWWPSADKQITILRINTDGTNLIVDNAAKTIKLRIEYS